MTELTRQQISEIRILSSFCSAREIAKLYGITRENVKDIVNYRILNTVYDSIYDIHFIFKLNDHGLRMQ